MYAGEDITFREFALSCARQFTPLAHQREDDLHAPIRPREVSSWYLERLAEAELELGIARERDLDEWAKIQEKDRQETIAKIREAIERNAERRVRYETMLAEVRGWSPPTEEHHSLKEYMIKQILDSIRSDCSYEPKIPPMKDVSVYADEQLDSLQEEVIYYRNAVREQKRLAEEANRWIDALNESLPTA